MKRLGSILLAAAMAAGLLAACGKDDSAAAQVESTPAPSSAAPVEEVDTYDPALLTGLEKGEDYPEGQRFVAVMVNNMSNTPYQQARPQAGLSDADVLVEIKVEGGITRFMALYENYETMPRVGPVRSARDQFFQLILPFHPLYVHVGESVVQKEYKNNYDYDDFDLNGDVYASLGHYDSEFQARGVAKEHTYTTSGEQIAATIESAGKEATIRPYESTIFDFVRYDEEPRVLEGPRASSITVQHSSTYRTYFDWDETAGKYMMSQYSNATGTVSPSVDENNDEQLAFDNVLVLLTDIHVYPGHEKTDLQEVMYDTVGYGYYFSGGRAEPVRWTKGAPDQVLRIVHDDAEMSNVKINPGKTYLAVVDLDEAENFAFVDPDAAASASSQAE